MASFVIEGGHRLSGDIYPQGAKNEVLQIICATLLTAEEVTVHNIPDILDVNDLIKLMRDIGVSVSKKDIDTYSNQDPAPAPAPTPEGVVLLREIRDLLKSRAASNAEVKAAVEKLQQK